MNLTREQALDLIDQSRKIGHNAKCNYDFRFYWNDVEYVDMSEIFKAFNVENVYLDDCDLVYIDKTICDWRGKSIYEIFEVLRKNNILNYSISDLSGVYNS